MKPSFEPVSDEILTDRNGCNTQMKIHWKINKKQKTKMWDEQNKGNEEEKDTLKKFFLSGYSQAIS